MIKTFYEQVLEEYDSVSSPYLCDTSETFEKIWDKNNETKNIIKSHVSNFIKEFSLDYNQNPTKFLFSIDYGDKFKSGSISEQLDLEYKADIKIRLDFLNWCIKNNLTI